MNCPECGAPVGADEKFCGNCGTPLSAAKPDEAPVSGDSAGEETIYSEPTPPPGPVPLPAQEAYVPDPAGSPEEPVTPAPAPPPVERAPAGQSGSKNKTIVIAVIIVVILLLCCCIAAVAGILLLDTTKTGDLLSMAMPGLLAAIYPG